MRLFHRILVTTGLVLGLATTLLHDTSLATAQSPTTGAIQGVITDRKTGEKLVGVTVIATSSVLQGAQTAITDDNGFYKITNLPPGEYLVTFYYLELTIERRGIIVGATKTTPVYQKLDQSRSMGEMIVIAGSAPSIDPTSTSHGITIAPGPATSTVSARKTPHNTEAYRRIDDNPFVRVDTAPLSTFSIDVDTASYSNVRRFLSNGDAPPRDAVRIEELINYFSYDYATPRSTTPFTVTTEIGPSPWNASYQVVRIGLRAKPISSAEAAPRNLVFLLDVSGSMSDANKLPLLVRSLDLLVAQLRPQDRISIVVYAGSSGLVLPTTPGDQKTTIREALAALDAGGSTNGGEGIQLAYAQARASFLEGGINRVILCTDGDFNVGVTSDGELTRLIEREREHGVFLSVLGFGDGNLKDDMMERLADRGNGNYAYIDSLDEARKVLVQQAGSTLITVAKDVKIQVELNPAAVAGYRLIGYENRLLRDQDFADDTVDAGDIGAGHAVTALYEIVPAGTDVPAARVDRLKYQRTVGPDPATRSELMTVKVRYKTPYGSASSVLSQPVAGLRPTMEQTSLDFRWALAVASYGMFLRASPHRGAMTWSQVKALASSALGTTRGPEGSQFLDLVDQAAKLVP